MFAVEAAPEVPRGGIGLVFTVLRAFRQPLRPVARPHEELRRPAHPIVAGAQAMMSAVEPEDGVPADVEHHPALTGVATILMDLPPADVVIVGHDDPTQRVGDCPFVALDVDRRSRRIELVDRDTVADEAVVGDRQEGAAERIDEGQPRRALVDGGLRSGLRLRRSQRPALAPLVPGGPIVLGGNGPQERTDIGVLAGIEPHGVVAVPGLAPPRVDHHLLERMIGVERRHHAPDGVVDQRR